MKQLWKKLIGWTLCLMMAVGMLPVAAREAKAADTDAGAGEGIVWNAEENCYEISSYEGLLEFAKIVNGTSAQFQNDSAANAKIVVEEIDASASNPENSGYDAQTTAWTPIGNSSSPYTGTFDGNGCTITGLTIESTNKYIGLFGYVGEGGCVQRVNLKGGRIKGNSDFVGGVAGSNDGTVSNCYNTGDVSGSDFVGGVAGSNYGTVTNCYNTGAVSGRDRVGGVVGYNYSGTVSNCYNTGAVSGECFVGGVAGWNNVNGTVSNCYNTGDVSGIDRVGGVVGYNYSGKVENCYNAGAVSGKDRKGRVGGVVGYNYSGTVSNCYNTGAVSGGYFVGGVAGYNYDGTVSNCYNTGDVSGIDRVGGVAGQNSGNGTVSNCYYNNSICQTGAINGSDNEDNKVTGLTTAKMTGENALSNMALSDSIWLTKAHGGSDEGQYYLYYPQLKGFNYKTDGTPETDSTQISSDNWPAKVEVSVTWDEEDSYTYNGTAQGPTVKSVIVGDVSVPKDAASVKYFQYAGSAWKEEGTSDVPDSPGLYKMECDVAGEKVTKYFSILSPEVDYAVSCLKSVNGKWEQLPESINSGEYKVVISWTENRYAIIEKKFEILSVPVTLTADSRDTDIYDGTEKSVSGFTCSVEGLTFDGVSANGKGIKQGKYDVTFSGVTLNDTKDTTGNYVVTAITNGTLTIKKKVLKITADSASADCDGTALTKNSYTISELAKGDSVESVTITGSQTGPGSCDNGPSAAKIVNADGEDVTDCYDITYVNGKLTVAEHSFNQEVADAKYQKSAADCTYAAVYFKSCKCGEKGTETFTSGEPLGHKWKAATGDAPKTCEVCGITEGDVIKYISVSGDTVEWTEGDGSLTLTFKRSEQDELCFQNYKETLIDQNPVKVEAKAGSTVITIDEATLKTFAAGTHTITAVFADASSEVKLVIKEPVAEAPESPKTGDSLPVLPLGIVLLAAIAAASAIVVKRRFVVEK